MIEWLRVYVANTMSNQEASQQMTKCLSEPVPEWAIRCSLSVLIIQSVWYHETIVLNVQSPVILTHAAKPLLPERGQFPIDWRNNYMLFIWSKWVTFCLGTRELFIYNDRSQSKPSITPSRKKQQTTSCLCNYTQRGNYRSILVVLFWAVFSCVYWWVS